MDIKKRLYGQRRVLNATEAICETYYTNQFQQFGFKFMNAMYSTLYKRNVLYKSISTIRFSVHEFRETLSYISEMCYMNQLQHLLKSNTYIHSPDKNKFKSFTPFFFFFFFYIIDKS